MYPAEGTSKRRLLQAARNFMFRQRTAEDIDLEDVAVNDPSNASEGSTLSEVVSKVRPLNLADDYEIVDGIPTIVRTLPRDLEKPIPAYAMSFDGNRIAVQEGKLKICVYEMLENFSLVAEWEDGKYEDVACLTFHNNRNTELVVLFQDSTVTLMYISMKSEDATELPEVAQQDHGTLAVNENRHILDEYDGVSELQFHMSNEGETWVLVFDYSARNIINLCSINREED